jgi:hypothetical protein
MVHNAVFPEPVILVSPFRCSEIKNRFLSRSTVSTEYTEYQSVCPFVGIGYPTPSSAGECRSPPPFGSKGETHSLAGEEMDPISTKRRTLRYSVFSIMPLRQ